MIQQNGSKRLCAILFATQVLTSVGEAAEGTGRNETTPLTGGQIGEDGKCHIEGNADLYGLGVRIGMLQSSGTSRDPSFHILTMFRCLPSMGRLIPS
jgi:hypothetical protein